MVRPRRGRHGGIRQLRDLIEEHSWAVEADLIRVGLRLRWVGDGTGRLTIRDLWALVNSLIGDETSALFRARSGSSRAERIAIDTLNALWMLNHNLRRAAGDKTARKFEPLRSYPGSPFDPPPRAPLLDVGAQLGGYKAGSRADITAWLQRRGLPTPQPTPSQTAWLDQLPAAQLDTPQLLDRIERL